MRETRMRALCRLIAQQSHAGRRNCPVLASGPRHYQIRTDDPVLTSDGVADQPPHMVRGPTNRRGLLKPLVSGFDPCRPAEAAGQGRPVTSTGPTGFDATCAAGTRVPITRGHVHRGPGQPSRSTTTSFSVSMKKLTSSSVMGSESENSPRCTGNIPRLASSSEQTCVASPLTLVQ